MLQTLEGNLDEEELSNGWQLYQEQEKSLQWHQAVQQPQEEVTDTLPNIATFQARREGRGRGKTH